MDPFYARMEDDSDSSFSCGPTPPNPNNDGDTSCLLRVNPSTLQPDPMATRWTSPTLSIGGGGFEQALPAVIPPLVDELKTGLASSPDSDVTKEVSSESSIVEKLHLLDSPKKDIVVDDDKLLHLGTHMPALDGLAAVTRDPDGDPTDAVDCLPDCNWPLLRGVCLGVFVAVWVALLGVCVALIYTMPTKCEPIRKWYQGHNFYELSAEDNAGDGGLRQSDGMFDYIRDLEVSAVIIKASHQDLTSSEDDRVLEQVRGALSADLKVILSINSSQLILSSPYDNQGGSTRSNNTVSVPASYPDIVQTLEFWLRKGVSGFFLEDAQVLTADPSIVVDALIQDVRNMLDRHSSGLHDRILMLPLQFARALHQLPRYNDTDILRHIDLLDCRLMVAGRSPQEIADQIDEALSLDISADAAWLNWRLDWSDGSTPGHAGSAHSVGATLLQSMLPGTLTLRQGDELDAARRDEGGSALQFGTDDAARSVLYGRSGLLPWKLTGMTSQFNVTIGAVRDAFHYHHTAVPLYVNGVFSTVGDLRPTRASNLKIRHVDADLLVLERFYPRQSHWGAIYNSGATYNVSRDLSGVFFRGRVLASSTGIRDGYLLFKDLQLMPGESVIVQLDQ